MRYKHEGRRHDRLRLSLVISTLVVLALACGESTPVPATVPEGEGTGATDVTESGTAMEGPQEEPLDEETEAAPVGATVTGQVTYFDNSSIGYVPDTEASVYVVGREDISAETDAEGRFTLAGVPDGLQLITAQSPIGNDHEQLTVIEGGDYTVDLVTYFGMPLLAAGPSGGVVVLDGEPVEGAKVWSVGPRQPILLVTDEHGYFGFETYYGPVIAVFGERWQVADLQPAEITTIHLERAGAVVSEPEVPISESVGEAFVLGGPVITPRPPIIVVTLVPPKLRVVEDCIPYEPQNLDISSAGAAGWILADGDTELLLLDNESDAEVGLALAQRHTALCFIGRNNARENPRAYTVQYWRGDSGIRTKLGAQDCASYDPENLAIRDRGADGWLLLDGSHSLNALANEADAKRALTLAERHVRHCFIGRGNQRLDRLDYIVEYWE